MITSRTKLTTAVAALALAFTMALALACGSGDTGDGTEDSSDSAESTVLSERRTPRTLARTGTPAVTPDATTAAPPGAGQANAETGDGGPGTRGSLAGDTGDLGDSFPAPGGVAPGAGGESGGPSNPDDPANPGPSPAPGETTAPGAPTRTPTTPATAPTPLPADKIVVVATTSQIGALTREVAGDRVQLTTLMKPGVDPHTYEPSASDLTAIEDADVVLRNGVGLDKSLDRTLRNATSGVVVTVTDTVPLRTGYSFGQPMDDPHVWHDPENLKLMTTEIAYALIDRDPANTEFYRQNGLRYIDVLTATRNQVQTIINEIPPADRKLVMDHDALGYFADRFGLQQIGNIIPNISTETEPSAQDLANIVEKIKAENVKAVFVGTTVNPAIARAVAEEAGVRLVQGLYTDSLGPPGSGVDTCHGMLLANARLIADGLT
jgi:ABC-type Zn uptake system ZnuABC Zn-binding protein ZnuA